jgi:hypothetical protein
MADLASLVIGLRADVATLQSDLGKAVGISRQSSESMQRAFGGISSSLESVGDAALDLGRIFLGGLGLEKVVEFGKSIVESNAKLADLSAKVGIGAQQLSAYSVAAQLAGTSIDAVGGGLTKLSRSANEAAHGNATAQAAFTALGVSVRDSSGALRSSDAIFDDVAKSMAGFRDGTGKTALAMSVLGKSGAELIPFLDEYGQNVDAAKKKSEELGLTISNAEASQFKQLSDTVTEVGLALRGDFTQAMTVLLPYLQDFADDALEAAKGAESWKEQMFEAITVFHDVKDAVSDITDLLQSNTEDTPFFEGILDGVKNDREAFARMKADAQTLWQDLKLGFAVAWNGGQPPKDFVENWNSDLDAVDQGLAESLDAANKWGEGVKYSGVVLSTLSDMVKDVTGSFTVNHASAAQYAADMAKVGQYGERAVAAGADQAQVARIVGAAYQNLGDVLEVSSRKASNGFDASGQSSAEMAKHLQSARDEATKLDATLDSFGADKYTKALADYNGKLDQIDSVFNKLVDSGEAFGKAIDFSGKETQKAAEGFDAIVQAMRNANDADAILAGSYARAESDLNNQIRLLGMDEESRKADELATRLNIAALGDLKDFMGPLTEAQQRIIDQNTELAKGFVAASDAIDKQKEVVGDYVSIWKSAGSQISDSISKWVVEGGSLMKSLTDVAKQVVEQIISYFVKLSVINPILNSIFGGTFGGGAGGGLLPTLSGAGGLIGSLGGGGSDAASATASGNSSLFGTAQSGYSLFEGGKNLWQGFQSGYQSFFSGSDAFTMGPPTEAGSTSSYYGGGYTSGLGQAIGVAGSLYAGYNRYQQGGALGGVAGGAAYAYGTYALGAGVSTAVATGSLAAGFSAIPVVGWIAIAAMLIDKFSGGKLFGTDANKFKFGQQTLDIAAGGATLSAGADYVGQKALFGGSYHEWKSLDVPQEAIDAANAFFDALKKGTDNFAQQFGVKMGDVVGGAFTTTFDKHGNVTATSSVVNGVTYKDTADQFQERLVAENELAVLGQFDSKLSAAIDKYRENADELAGVVNSLAAAQLGFNEGLKLLALGSDQSTSGLLQLAEASGKFGESITDTISRILQSQAQYDQFVAQFKPATNYVDDYEASLSQINQAMLANIKQANDLAKAAGAQGASEQDLANIHKYAAQQAAQALAALESSAQSLAFGLGLTTQGSLDQVNQEVAALQSRAGNATQPIQNFGQAMSDAADRAKHAQDLLLGDLSPLNDQQKLQTALSGLRSGTVTQDQVLDIGRRLYASTAQYTALFNMVQAIGQHTGTTGFSGAATTGTHTGLSTEESKRLADLLKEQQSLQAAAQLQQYQTLAQQVAEIASSKGEDWQQVLKEMGVNIDDFEKGLNLTDQQTQDYITAIQNQTDSAGDNTKSIVDVLNQILVALGGTPTNSGGTPFGGDQPVGQFGGNGGTTANTPFGTGPVGSFGGGRSLSDGDANAVGAAVARHNPGLGHSQRGTRPVRAGATTRI